MSLRLIVVQFELFRTYISVGEKKRSGDLKPNQWNWVSNRHLSGKYIERLLFLFLENFDRNYFQSTSNKNDERCLLTKTRSHQSYD